MNKKLSPLVLLLLGLVIASLGGNIGGALGVGLSFGGLACIVFAIIGGVNKLFGGGSIESTTKATARAMATSFFALKSKYDYPIKTPSDKIKIYTEVLRLRPGYTDDVIKEVLRQSEKFSEIWGDTQGISLNTLVFVIVIREYNHDKRKMLTEDQMEKIRDTIDRVF